MPETDQHKQNMTTTGGPALEELTLSWRMSELEKPKARQRESGGEEGPGGSERFDALEPARRCHGHVFN